MSFIFIPKLKLTRTTPSAENAYTAEEEVVVVIRQTGILNVVTICGYVVGKSDDGDIVSEGAFTSKVVSLVL